MLRYIQLLSQRNFAQMQLMFSNNELYNKILETKITVLNGMLKEYEGKRLNKII